MNTPRADRAFRCRLDPLLRIEPSPAELTCTDATTARLPPVSWLSRKLVAHLALSLGSRIVAERASSPSAIVRVSGANTPAPCMATPASSVMTRSMRPPRPSPSRGVSGRSRGWLAGEPSGDAGAQRETRNHSTGQNEQWNHSLSQEHRSLLGLLGSLMPHDVPYPLQPRCHPWLTSPRPVSSTRCAGAPILGSSQSHHF